MKNTTILIEGLVIAFVGLAGCGSAIDATTPTNGGTSSASTSGGTSGGSTGGSSTGGTRSGTTGSVCNPTPPWDIASPDDLSEAKPAEAVEQQAVTTGGTTGGGSKLLPDGGVDPKCLAACDAALATCLAPCKTAYNKAVTAAENAWIACVLANPIGECTNGICTAAYNASIAAAKAARTKCQSPCWTAFNNCQTDCGVKNND